MRVVFLIALTLVGLAYTSPGSAQSSFTGVGRSIDGDSLYVGGREVRLFGIDAPEYHQSCTRAGKPWSCGANAAARLSSLVTGKLVRCDQVDTDEHGRTVARCSVGSVDVNRTMVATGYATAYRHYSLDYVSAEESARVNKRGIWSGTFEMPRDYRVQERVEGETHGSSQSTRHATVQRGTRATSARSNCLIKGNRGSHGWIYHVPGMPYYGRTHAEEWFCTEAQARAAGYRRAKVWH